MQTTNLNEDQFFDMFNVKPEEGAQNLLPQENGFRLGEQDADIFANKLPDTPPQGQLAESTEGADTSKEGNKEDGSEGGEEGDDGIFFQHDEDAKKAGRRPKYNFSDSTGYFEDRIKAGKFVPIEVENEKGEVIPFIPKSPEDYDEFIDFQLNHKFQEKEKQIEENWLQTKSPAFQYLAEYAEKVDDPNDLTPFIQGIKNIDDVNAMNEAELDGAESIYRTWLVQRGEPADVIERQIEMAKTSNQLLDFAKSYKPILVQREQQSLAKMNADAQTRQQKIAEQVFENEQKAITSINAPLFGKQKLKDDEKQLVYSMIGRPVKELGGYPIYHEIDKLFANKDFDTLRELSLLLGKKESYLKYAANNTAQGVATGLQRTLRVANEPNKNGNDGNQPPAARAQSQVRKTEPIHNHGFTRRPV